MNNAALLTCTGFGFTLLATGNKPDGRRNPFFIIGVKPPQPFVAFLCASYCAALCRLFIMAGCFWEALRLAAPMSGIPTPKPQPAAHAVGSMIGGYSLLNHRIHRMNTSQSSHAQNPTPPKLTPDFSHRLSVFGGDATPLSLSNSIESLSLQATSVLNMVAGQFVGTTDSNESTNELPDEIIYWSIESAIALIKDMNAIVRAYHHAQREADKDKPKNPRA